MCSQEHENTKITTSTLLPSTDLKNIFKPHKHTDIYIYIYIYIYISKLTKKRCSQTVQFAE